MHKLIVLLYVIIAPVDVDNERIERKELGPMVLSSVTQEEFLTVPDVARLLRVGESTVRKWAAAGKIPFVELPGGEYRIPRLELVRGLRGNVDIELVLGRVQERLADLDDAVIAQEVRAAREAQGRTRA
ncbi:MAG: helix-turn-helix domain-containing protein [Actinomycetota bacterium]